MTNSKNPDTTPEPGVPSLRKARPAAAPPHPSERRKHRRFPVERPGKVFRRATRQFAAAHSRDLSFAGALLDVDSPRPFTVGEIVDLGIAMRHEPVVPGSCMVQAVVVRAQPFGESRQTVAVRYINSGAAQLTN